MPWGPLDQHKILKRFMLIYIAGFIAALFAFISVAQALEPIKQNPMSAGTFITEPETCPNGIVGTDVFTTDEIDSNGVHYWQRHTPIGNSYMYFYQSDTVPGCTDASAAPAGTTITGVNGFKLWVAYTGLQTGIFHSPLVDANHGLIGYPTLVNSFTVDGRTVDLAYYTFAVNDFKNLAITPLQSDGGRLYLTKITADDLSTIDSQEKLYALIRSSSPVLTLGEKAAALAKTLKGAPYGYGGKGYDYKVVPNSYVDANAIFGGYNYYLANCNTGVLGVVSAKGIDCSGLVMWSYNTAFSATTNFSKGNPIQYPSANGQYLHDATIAVSKDDLKPGDLLFFNYGHGTDPDTKLLKEADHVAMYVGGDDVLEAYTCLSQYPSGNYVIPSSKRTRNTTDPFGLSLPQCIPGTTKPCFVGFRRVPVPVTISSVKLRITTRSPVTLAVTDPDGFSITADTLSFTDREVLREVADVLYYIEESNSDDTVISPVLKTGAYLIKVFPKPSTRPTDTYSVLVDTAGSTLTLADKVPIRNIPSQGYGIRSTGAAISQFIPVAIDIKPGSSDNPINPKSNGEIPVAILSSTMFNAPREVDVASLSFGRTGNERSLAFCNTGGEDVNGDGLLDLMCHFDNQTAAFRSGDTQGILNGKTVNAIPITGKDSVRIVP
jgi:cell wall-associated NlpC family hydrolase